MACRLCVIHVREDNDSNVKALITRLIWTVWASLSAALERPLNLITHSLTFKPQTGLDHIEQDATQLITFRDDTSGRLYGESIMIDVRRSAHIYCQVVRCGRILWSYFYTKLHFQPNLAKWKEHFVRIESFKEDVCTLHHFIIIIVQTHLKTLNL